VAVVLATASSVESARRSHSSLPRQSDFKPQARRLVGRLAVRDRRGREALTHLAGDDVRHYRALWQYVLASWAVIAAWAGDRDQRHDLTNLVDFSPVGTA
jgi:hypothetical protein